MVTEREKMINGEEFNLNDEELVDIQSTAHQAVHMYNQLDNKNSRQHLLEQLFGTVGEGAHIEPTLRLDYGFNIHVGKNFNANFNSTFVDAAPITIGNNVMFGPGVSITTVDYPLEPEKRNKGIRTGRPITIGDNCYIGTNAVILGGVKLGENVVVRAGTVVNESFEDNVVIAGNPARIIHKIETE